MDQITAFYLHQGTDHKGRTLKQIWNFSDNELEVGHDYIQWLFPTTVASKFNSNAPLLTSETICEFLEHKEAIANLIVSSYIFQRFLKLDEPTPFWVKKTGGRDNHNCLRISRVIASLSILEQQERADDFYSSVLNVYMVNNPSPIFHWDFAHAYFGEQDFGERSGTSPLSLSIWELIEAQQ